MTDDLIGSNITVGSGGLLLDLSVSLSSTVASTYLPVSTENWG
jgi:hypothetical protein